MRKRIVAGNWKMNLDYEQARTLAEEVAAGINDLAEREIKLPEVLLFAPAPYLHKVAGICSETPGLQAGIQNINEHEKGAFTGEQSAVMAESVGATHVLVGHSERRAIFGEDNALLAKKTDRALKPGLVPVYCCGESLPERESGRHFEVVGTQLSEGLFWLDENSFKKVIIAYEPVWAIGTGVTASPEQAQEMHAFIRQLIEKHYGRQLAEQTVLLYGGSCNAGNAADLFSRADVDGGLIGGASLKADEFLKIIQSF